MRLAAVVFAVHAPLSEVIQHVVLPGRSGDVWDAVVDLAGVGLGAAVLGLVGVVGARRRRW